MTPTTLFIITLFATILALWQLGWLLVYTTRCYGALVLSRLAGAPLWQRAHPLRDYALQRFPRTYRFAAQRLEPRQFTGLPLTLIILATLYIVALLGGLLEELFERYEIIAFDLDINARFTPYRTRVLVAAFAWITDLGNSATLVGVVVVSTGFLWADRRAHLILPLWVTVLGSQATTYLGKYAIDRPRPEFLTGVTAYTPSFPSGHATGAMAVYGFIIYAIVRAPITLRLRYEIIFWGLTLILLISLSRVFLSVHFASDVAAGLLVGIFWLLIGVTVAENRHRYLPLTRYRP